MVKETDRLRNPRKFTARQLGGTIYAIPPWIYGKYIPLFTVLGLALLAGCHAQAHGPTYEQMAADRKLNLQVLKQCREHRESISDDTCMAAARADGKWFMGSGKSKYTPEPIHGLNAKPRG